MIVGVGRIELLLGGAQSLKDKRQVMKSLSSRIARRFNVSVSEIDNHELWQRGTLAVAHVSQTQREVEKLLHKVSAFAESNGHAEVIRCTYTYFNPEQDV